MKYSLSIPLLSMALTSCGGGGGGAGAPQTPTPPPPPQQLSAYLGEWQTPCRFHNLDSVTITRVSADTISISPRSEYFVGENCTGALLATETYTAPFIIKHTGTTTADVVFHIGTNAVQSTVDKVNVSIAQYSSQFTGTGVVHTVRDGLPQWCIDYGNGESTCVLDQGIQPAQASSGALFATGSEMYTLEPSGSLYVVDTKYTRK